MHVIDSRFKPNINSATTRVVASWSLRDFHDRERFGKLYWLLSREAVRDGSIERFAQTQLPIEGVAVRQYSLFPEEVRDFDDDFLGKLDNWRSQLAVILNRARKGLTGEQLTEAVQRTIDRLIFMRFLEDKKIEPDRMITSFGASRQPAWNDFVASSRRLDNIYNGVVFKPHPILDDPSFAPNSAHFAEICDELTDDHSPYNFASIPVEILGRIYERFLGKIIQLDEGTPVVVEKDDVRKAGGVYYTPDYIVNYMVQHSLGSLINGKTVQQILLLRVIDTACGSGSFLIGAFSQLSAAILSRIQSRTKANKKGANRDSGMVSCTFQCHSRVRYSRSASTELI